MRGVLKRDPTPAEIRLMASLVEGAYSMLEAARRGTVFTPAIENWKTEAEALEKLGLCLEF